MKRLDLLSKLLKKTSLELSEEQWKYELSRHLERFELNYPALDEIPSSFKHSRMTEFVHATQSALLQNPYFLAFIERLPEKDFVRLEAWLHRHGDGVCEMLGFAFCLERVNVLMREDNEVLAQCLERYKSLRKSKNYYRPGNVLGAIKLHSIELPLILFLRAKKKMKMPKSFGSFILSFNIFEAFLVDMATGLFNNAISAIPLMLFSPNFKGALPWLRRYRRGAPSAFSKDYGAVELLSPAPKEWADLYQVWNMAFVSQFHEAPYLLIKLIIPSVSDYTSAPGEYMHKRITALYLTMNLLEFKKQENKKVPPDYLGPLDRSVVKMWGEINRLCARQYKKSILKSKPDSRSRFKLF